MDSMSITSMKMAGDLAVTIEQYQDPTPTVRPVSGTSRNEAAATLDAFDLAALIQPPAWQAEAACIGAPPGLFFSERGENLKQDQARAICAECPVTAECLEYGLMEKHGIWGGMSERERRRVRRQRAIAAGQSRPAVCVVCGDEFEATSNAAKLCSEECRATRGRVLAKQRAS